MKAFKPSGKPLTAIVLSLSLFAAPTISHSSGESMTPANPNNLYSEIKNNWILMQQNVRLIAQQVKKAPWVNR